MNQRLRGGIVFLVLGIAAVAGGAYLAAPHFQDVRNSQPVDAEILSSDWESDRSAGDSTDYYARITYRYTYDGAEYTSDTVFPGGRGSEGTRSRVVEVANNYSAGDRVTAHVDPADPAQSFLVKESPPYWYYLIPGFGALLILAALLNIVQGIRGVGPQGTVE